MLSNNGYKSDSVIDLFESKELITMCAPMVRYSKLPFRMLVRKYGCDVAFTPMIVSHSFVESEKARHSDFSTAAGDRPLIVQFAANNGVDLADATELVYRKYKRKGSLMNNYKKETKISLLGMSARTNAEYFILLHG